MFEDRTFENLQEEMREESTLEGVLIETAIAKQAVRLEEAYADLDAINENMLVDTQDRDHLIDSGAECGLPILDGTPASVRGLLNCECEAGTEFTAIDADVNFTVIQELDPITIDDVLWYRYEMEADENGVEPGDYRGDIEPIDEVDGFEEGYIDATITPGTEDEETEDYRERRLNAFQSQACAGNREYYHDTIENNFSVMGVKSARRVPNATETASDSAVNIFVQGPDGGVASASLLAEIAEAMDPDGSAGEGLGLNPFGSVLNIQSVAASNIAVTATFTFDEGYTFAGLKSTIEAAVDGYFAELRETWGEDYNELWETKSGEIVRISHIEAAILGVEGVLDITATTINGEESNLTLGVVEIPVLSGVSENG